MREMTCAFCGYKGEGVHTCTDEPNNLHCGACCPYNKRLKEIVNYRIKKINKEIHKAKQKVDELKKALEKAERKVEILIERKKIYKENRKIYK